MRLRQAFFKFRRCGLANRREREARPTQRGLFLLQQNAEHVLRLIEKMPENLVMGGLVIRGQTRPGLSQFIDVRSRAGNEQRGMGGDDKLRPLSRQPVNPGEQSHLPRRGHAASGSSRK